MTAQAGFSEVDWQAIALDTLAERPQPGTAIAPGTENGRPSRKAIVRRTAR